MVVTALPATCETGVEQERVDAPSTCTVQAPHSPAPQPNFVPVSCSVSRKTQSRGVSGATFTVRSFPLTRKLMLAILPQSLWTKPIIVAETPKKRNDGDQLALPCSGVLRALRAAFASLALKALPRDAKLAVKKSAHPVAGGPVCPKSATTVLLSSCILQRCAAVPRRFCYRHCSCL